MAEQKSTRKKIPDVCVVHPVTGKTSSQHVVFAEMALGHKLPKGAHVHHVNGNHADNRRSNLVICQDASYHHLLHVRQRVKAAGGNPNTDKLCGRCHQVKPKSDFSNHKTNFDGKMKFCRVCDAARYAKRHSPTYRRAPVRTLSDEVVLAILSSPGSQTALSKRYGVSMITIYRIKRGLRRPKAQAKEVASWPTT